MVQVQLCLHLRISIGYAWVKLVAAWLAILQSGFRCGSVVKVLVQQQFQIVVRWLMLDDSI